MQGYAWFFILPPLLLAPAMGLLSLVRSTHRIGDEFRRKALHVATGLCALSLPSILPEPWMVVTGLVLVLSWMGAIRITPCLNRRFGPVLHDCRRRSMGEIWFALGLAILLLFTSGLAFVIAVLVLALADAAAAIAGRMVPSRRLTGLMRGKTVAGCTAFFCTAVMICLPMLALHTDLSAARIATATLLVAALACIAEAGCRRGLDNLVVPLVTAAAISALPV